jgi:hypothetical protein
MKRGYYAEFDVRGIVMTVRSRRSVAAVASDTNPPKSSVRRSPSASGPLELEPNVCDRVRLIGELSRLIHDCEVPEAMRSASLELIGYLARRFPGEAAHHVGVPTLPRCGDSAPARRRRS